MQINQKLSHHDLGCALADAGHAVEQLYRHPFVLQPLLDFGADSLHRLVQIVEVAQLLDDHEGVMRCKPADHHLRQLVALGPQPPARKIRQQRPIGFTCHQRIQDRACGDPTDISHDRGELDVRVFQHGLQPVG